MMSTREHLDAALDRQEQMLPVWLEKLRHEAQFWPQFVALTGAILAGADPADQEYAVRRIADMLAANGMRSMDLPLAMKPPVRRYEPPRRPA